MAPIDADDIVPFPTYKCERVPPKSVPTRLGEDVFAVKCEDVGENVIRELRYGWLWRRTC
jgi:hypothetical protein